MTLKKYADTDGKFSDEDWDHNVDEIEARLTNAQTTAENAVGIVWTAASEAAMLLLSDAKRGHLAKRTDTKTYYILTASGYGTLDNWLLIGNYEATLNSSHLASVTAVADADERDALTPVKGDKVKQADNNGVYQWTGAAWTLLGHYIITEDQITGDIPQSKVTNLISDLAALAADILAVQGGILQYRFVLNFGDLSGGAGTSDIRNIFPLGPLHTLHGCRVFTENAFTSAGNTTFTSRVFYNGVDLIGSGSSMTSPSHRVSNTMLAGSVLGGDSVELEVTTDTDITDWTAGKLVIWIYYSINDNS